MSDALTRTVAAAIQARIDDGRWLIWPHPRYRDLVSEEADMGAAFRDYRLWLFHEAADAALAALAPASAPAAEREGT